MITFDNVSFSYGEQKVLSNINLTINDREFVCILGRNGSGKSTLARLCNGILIPEEGCVIIDGMKIDSKTDTPTLKKIRERVGIVFQNPDNQMVTSPLEDEAAFGPENLCLSSDEIEKRVSEALEMVGLLKFRKKNPLELSGGEKQKAAIAGVLAMKPHTMVLDEPTSMLDPLARRELMGKILELKEKLSLSIILITHHMEEAVFSDRVIIMNKGEILNLGTPEEIFSDYETLKKASLILPEITTLGKLLFEKGLISKRTVLCREELLEELK